MNEDKVREELLRYDEWVSAMWKHPCGHVCEWALPTPYKPMKPTSKVKYAAKVTLPFIAYNCPWCGAATGTFFIPKTQKTIYFHNANAPLLVTRMDDPDELLSDSFASILQERRGTSECCQVCGSRDFHIAAIKGVSGRYCKTCSETLEKMFTHK